MCRTGAHAESSLTSLAYKRNKRLYFLLTELLGASSTFDNTGMFVMRLTAYRRVTSPWAAFYRYPATMAP